MSPFAHLRKLIADNALEDALDATGHDEEASIAYLVDGRRHYFSSKGDHKFSENTRVDIGCLVTNLTSLLVAMAVKDGKLTYDDLVVDYFPSNSASSAVRIRHLLSHSHGLDGSSCLKLPYTDEGYIDGSRLWGLTSNTRSIAPPGSMFYYWGGIGYWLAAAILECVYSKTFAELISERILLPFLGRDPNSVPIGVCPAAGGLSLSSRELLDLCYLHLQHNPPVNAGDPISSLSARCAVPVPAWPPICEAVCLGWFRYAGNTLGISGNSAAILISPIEASAIAMTSPSVHRLRSTLFGPLLLPWKKSVRPRILSPAEVENQDLGQYVGVYTKFSLALRITIGADNRLCAEVFRAVANGTYEPSPFITRTMIAAEGDVFFARVPEPVAIPYVKFDRIDSRDYTHAISGVHVFRRL